MMKEVILERFAYTPMGTFGRLYVFDNGSASPIFERYTVERPWVNNQRNVSCIPEGVYHLMKAVHYGGDGVGGNPDYPCYEIANVPNRSLIHIHIANTMDDLAGCVAPGTHLGYVKNRWAVLNSRKAFGEFMQAMEDVEHASIDIHFTKFHRGLWENVTG